MYLNHPTGIMCGIFPICTHTYAHHPNKNTSVLATSPVLRIITHIPFFVGVPTLSKTLYSYV